MKKYKIQILVENAWHDTSDERFDSEKEAEQKGVWYLATGSHYDSPNPATTRIVPA